MSHELVDAESMAYAVSGGRPWHGLGIPIEENLPPSEFITRCKLNWNVDVVPMPTEISGIKMPQRTNMLVRPAIYKGETQRICLDIVGNKFKPVQNIDAANVFAQYVEDGQMTMETAGALRNGEVVWFLAKTTEAFELANGDKIEGYFLLMSPHKAGKSFIAKFILTRVVCANTLAVGLNEAGLARGEWRMRHSRELDAAAIEEMNISLGIKAAMSTYQEQATLLSNTRISEQGNVVYLAKVFTPDLVVNDNTLSLADKDGNVVQFPMPKTIDAVADIPAELLSGKSLLKRVAKSFNDQPGFEMGRGTVWNAFNGVTNFLDNVAGKPESRMYNSVLGRSIAIKNNAMNDALKLANAA